MGRDRRGWDNVLFAPSSGGRGGNGYVFRYFLFSILLFPSSHCSYFPIISFFAKIINRRAGAGPDRTDAGGDRNAGRDGGGGNGYLLCYFLFSTLFISSSHSSSFPIVCVRQQAGRDRAGRKRTDAGGNSNEGRDRGAGGREEEVEGRAGGRRRRGGKRK